MRFLYSRASSRVRPVGSVSSNGVDSTQSAAPGPGYARADLRAVQPAHDGRRLAGGEPAHPFDHRDGADRPVAAIEAGHGQHRVVAGGPGDVDGGLGGGVEGHRDDHAG